MIQYLGILYSEGRANDSSGPSPKGPQSALGLTRAGAPLG